MNKRSNITYAGLYGEYCMLYCVFVSFCSVYLLANGYTNSEIGIITASSSIFAAVLQLLLADFADRSKHVSVFLLVGILGIVMAVLTSFMFFLHGRSIAIALVYVVLLAFQTVIQPLLNSMNAIFRSNGIRIYFGMCRSMGSIAYGLLCIVMGILIKIVGISLLPIVSEAVIALMICNLLLSLKGNNKSPAADNPAGEVENINLILFIRRNKLYFIMNIGIVFLYFHNQILNNYMLQIVSNVGGDSSDMSMIFSLMSFAEIPTLICFDNIIKRVNCRVLLKTAAAGFVLRIILITIANSVTMIFWAQLSQLVSFALFLPAMIYYIEEIMSKGEAVKGQALYTSMVTLSAVLGSLFGGIILDALGVREMMIIATAATVIGAIAVTALADKIKPVTLS